LPATRKRLKRSAYPAIVTNFVATQVLAAATAAPPFQAAVPKTVPSALASLSPQLQQQLQQYSFNAHKSPLAINAPWLTHTFAGIFLILAVSLIVLLAVQTTKQEGLSGTIGGKVESAYRPRLGFDQQLARITSFVALAMVFFGVLVSLTGI
jgi:protein translocase SecG subunit